MAGASERVGAESATRGEVGGRVVAWLDRGGGGAAAALAALRERIAADPESARAAALGGPALALLAFEVARDGGAPEPAFAVSVGDAVARGVPTAARVTLTGRAPEREGVTEAQVGGEFARAMAAADLDVLVVSGAGPAAALQLGAGVAPVAGELASEGRARTPISARAAALLREGECALLVGPAAEAGLPFANVASVDGPRDAAPSFVGRGGLGSALARAGVVAIVAAIDRRELGRSDLASLLKRSPRLAARAAEGTLELGAPRAARDLAAKARGRPREKHGCRGCPTPCGWVFDLPGGRAVGGRFSALRGAFGRGGDALEFVERCNALGVDAVAAAGVLEGDPPEDLLREGSAARARALARADTGSRAGRLSAGSGAPDVTVPGDLAAAVGVRVSARGPEPLRSLSVFGLAPAAAAEVVAPLPWTDGADPAADAGALARWHECFAAALDIVGFCAFSGAGLVADGVVTPGDLAARLAPGGSAGGWGGGPREQEPVRDPSDDARAMLAAGAAHLARHRRLGGGAVAAADLGPDPRRIPDPHTAPDPRPAGDALARAIDAYWRVAAAPFDGVGEASVAREVRSAPFAASPPESPGSPGSVRIVATGFLAERLGAGWERRVEFTVEAEVATAAAAVRALAASRPGARRWLLGPGDRVLPAVLVGGAPVDPAAPLGPDATVELVLLIPGG